MVLIDFILQSLSRYQHCKWSTQFISLAIPKSLRFYSDIAILIRRIEHALISLLNYKDNSEIDDIKEIYALIKTFGFLRIIIIVNPFLMISKIPNKH